MPGGVKEGDSYTGGWENVKEGMGSTRGLVRWKPGLAASSPYGALGSSPPWWGGGDSPHQWTGENVSLSEEGGWRPLCPHSWGFWKLLPLLGREAVRCWMFLAGAGEGRKPLGISP